MVTQSTDSSSGAPSGVTCAGEILACSAACAPDLTAAGIPELRPYVFRHTFAHEWRLAGGGDDSLMRLVGWTSRQMLHRYGASAADARGREAHRRFMLGDRM